MAESRADIISKLIVWKSFKRLKEKLNDIQINVLQWINKALTDKLGQERKKLDKVDKMAKKLSTYKTNDFQYTSLLNLLR